MAPECQTDAEMSFWHTQAVSLKGSFVDQSHALTRLRHLCTSATAHRTGFRSDGIRTWEAAASRRIPTADQ